MDKLVQYNCPGNVAVLAKSEVMQVTDLPEEIRRTELGVARSMPSSGSFRPMLEEVEKQILQQALERLGWNQTHAAKYLNISRKTLIYRMEKFALLPPAQSSA